MKKLVVILILWLASANLMGAEKTVKSHIKAGIDFFHQDKIDDAMFEFKQAIAIEPSNYEANRWMGYLYLLREDKENALEHFARALKTDPESTYVHKALKKIFTQRFPTWLGEEGLKVSPVAFEQHKINSKGIIYTAELLYPETETAIIRDPKYRHRFNRVCYGYGWEEQRNRYELKFKIYYPSQNLSTEGKDHSQVVKRVARMLSQFWVYGKEYLGRETMFSPEHIINVWLCEHGFTGGEQWSDNIYVYNINVDRDAVEWIREIAHEYGHHILPGIDGFEEPERWANGYLGELLFIKWLVAHTRLQDILEIWDAQPDLHGWVKRRAEGVVKLFLKEGPPSKLLTDATDAGLAYYLGLAMYMESALGTKILNQTFEATSGNTCADFLAGIVKTFAKLPNFTVFSGVELKPSDRTSCWVYLSQGKWGIGLVARTTTHCNLKLLIHGEKEDLESDLSIRGEGQQEVSIYQGEFSEEWYKFELVNQLESNPIEILNLKFAK